MQAYDKKRRRVVNVERSKGDVIVAYSLPGEPGIWYFPLIENGKNVEPYEIIEHEQISLDELPFKGGSSRYADKLLDIIVEKEEVGS